MSTLTKILGGVLIAVLLVGGVVQVKQNKNTGSVNFANEYLSTTTRNYVGVAMTNLSVLKTTGGTLGSVVITGAAAGTINLYDATSTVTNALWPTTTIATIPASAAAGTYTFDVAFQKGLLVEILGTTPSTTITFR